ncbi:MAG: peptide deformylase [Clostridia bacterium]|nr:peptide deformylase [Clostridia bacterium]
MAILNIVKFGDDLLRKRCRPIDEITPKIKTLIDDMIDTMRKADGCGLAAPQVGILRRLAVIEAEEGVVHVLINPEIVKREGEEEEVEGCLSNPGKWGYVKRPAKVTLRALDRDGVPYEIEAEGLLCRAICHECDHLDGKLYTDFQTKPYIPD